MVPLKDIHSVVPTRNYLSAPALSFYRVEIRYGTHRTVLISPENLEAFTHDLGWGDGSGYLVAEP